MADPTARHRKILDEAKKRFKRGMEWENTARLRGVADEKFANGDSVNNWQWNNRMHASRVNEDKPALTINKAAQHNLQVINDARQNKATIRIRPTGGGATYQAAQCLMGLIRHIEYTSNAPVAYDKATNDQVISGIGYVTLETDYVSADSFDQEIYIRRVGNPQSVLLDCDIQEFDGSDANWGFIFTDVPNDQFEAKYGKSSLGATTTLNSGGWVTKDTTRVAKYYRREMKPDTLFVTEDGATIKASECAGTEMLTQLREAVRRKEIRSRKILTPDIEVFKIAGNEIIEESAWAGSYVPIARMVGIETVIDGVMDRRGHTRCMLDAQRMYNYHASSQVEHTALQTKAPWVGSAESVEGRVEEWARANTSNPAVLTFNAFDEEGRPLEKPERISPPVASQAFSEGMQAAANDLMSVTGQYQAELGMPGNEKSGVAIGARQRQSSTATYHFTDHGAITIRYVGRMLVDLIPKIYDTKRVVRILAPDGSDVEATIDPEADEAHTLTPQTGAQAPTTDNVFKAAQAAALIFNPGVGTYDVQADVGANYGTQREEAFAAYTQILQSNHEMLPLIGDLMFKAADFPGADEIAERMAEQRQGSVVPAAQMQQVQQQLQQLHGILVQTTEALAEEKRKASAKDSLRDVEIYDSETRRMTAVAQVDPAALLPLIRQMVSQVLGTPALPEIAAHQAANASMAPASDNMPPDPLAIQQQAHAQGMDHAKLGLAANAQHHGQQMDVLKHGLAVHQALQPNNAPAA